MRKSKSRKNIKRRSLRKSLRSARKSRYGMTTKRSMKSTRKLTSRIRKSILKIKAPKSKSRRTGMGLTHRLSLIKRGTRPLVPNRARNTGGINDLPPETLEQIMSYLTGKDLMSTSQVSSQWYNLSRQAENEIPVPFEQVLKVKKIKKKFPYAKIIPIVATKKLGSFLGSMDNFHFKEYLLYDYENVEKNPLNQAYLIKRGIEHFNRVLGTQNVDGKQMARVRRYDSEERDKLDLNIFREMMGYK